MQVRRARLADWPAVWRLLEEMHAENALAPIAWRKVNEAMWRIERDGWLLLAESEGETVGLLALEVATPWYSESPYLQDRALFVTGSSRQGVAALALLRRAKVISDELGVPLCMGVRSPVNPERKSGIFTSLGFQPLGGSFIYNGPRPPGG